MTTSPRRRVQEPHRSELWRMITFPPGEVSSMAKHRRTKHRRTKHRPAVTRRTGDTVEFTRGIDVSHHQGQVDWARVAASGIRYAFMKATQGAGFIDSRFVANWAGAALNGVVRGAYHFFDPGATAAQQFENFTNVVSLEPGDLAPALDLELDGQNWTDLPSAQRIPV